MKNGKSSVTLSPEQRDDLLRVLKARFEKSKKRFPGLDWDNVQTRLEGAADKLWSLYQMESTGGEPNVVAYDKKTGRILFFDCSPQSPKGRFSLCYDQDALNSRKEHKPKGSAVAMAAAMGIELLTEEQYQLLQDSGEFDTKSSSWLKTPSEVRKLGGAIFGDRRFGRVFVYHNGAESYYSGRGFRGQLEV
ncbi:MAG TPA: DUF4256 domain-containing protein [Opitutaceae bacterium]|nr:DUF4256 domain-containing protein [Opitutaceae bacterium]